MTMSDETSEAQPSADGYEDGDDWVVRICKEGRAERYEASRARNQRIADLARQIAMDPARPTVVPAIVLISGIIVSEGQASPSALIVDGMQSLGCVYLLSPSLMAEYHDGLHQAYAMKYHHMDHAQVDELLESIAKGGLWQEPPAGAPQAPPSPNGQPVMGEAKPAGLSAAADAREPWPAKVQAYVARARRLSAQGWVSPMIHQVAVGKAVTALERALAEKQPAQDEQSAPSRRR